MISIIFILMHVYLLKRSFDAASQREDNKDALTVNGALWLLPFTLIADITIVAAICSTILKLKGLL